VGELLLQSADWLGHQSFSRQDEYEADATGWELLIQSTVTTNRRYNPQALSSLLLV
jgi:predicted Zn-dependent protease